MEEIRSRFMELSSRIEIKKNDIIFFEEDASRSCFYLESGIVKIFRISYSGKEPIFFIRREGEVFGLAEVVDDQPRKCNAQALANCVLYALPRSEFERLVSTEPQFALRVVSVLGSRIRYLGEQIENLMVCDVNTRLAKLLVYLAYEHLTDADSWERPVTLENKLTQEQMASMTGSCQQTVSESLKSFQNDGLILIERRKITILKPLTLLHRAEK
jgi:CRP-like cAMP-binding protein